MEPSERQPAARSASRATAVAAALSDLGIRPNERVLIMLPDGPGFADAFSGAVQRGAVPLPVNPGLTAADVAAIATETGARLVLAPTEWIQGLSGLEAEPLILVEGLQGLWAAALSP
jgi:acyl-CoA synthetase (AMP-forming)/AMP-acid ligase II